MEDQFLIWGGGVGHLKRRANSSGPVQDVCKCQVHIADAWGVGTWTEQTRSFIYLSLSFARSPGVMCGGVGLQFRIFHVVVSMRFGALLQNQQSPWSIVLFEGLIIS
jgi:hypothetical protein